MKIWKLLALGSFVTMASGSATAETYEIDPAHVEIGFSIRHMGISNVRGKFEEFTGTIEYDGSDLSTFTVNGIIMAKSLNTGIPKRDEHLRNEDFFDVAAHAEIIFVTKAVIVHGDHAHLKGELTMHGVKKEVSLRVAVVGPIEDPWNNRRIGVELSGVIKRHEWGVGSNESSDKLIGTDVKIEVNLEAVQK